jgi:hypothetical protein
MAKSLIRKQALIREEKATTKREARAEIERLVGEVASLRKDQPWEDRNAELDAIHQKELQEFKASFEVREKLYEAKFKALGNTSAGEQQVWDEIHGKNFLIRNGAE